MFFLSWTMCLKSLLSETSVVASYMHIWPQKEALDCKLVSFRSASLANTHNKPCDKFVLYIKENSFWICIFVEYFLLAIYEKNLIFRTTQDVRKSIIRSIMRKTVKTDFQEAVVTIKVECCGLHHQKFLLVCNYTSQRNVASMFKNWWNINSTV